MAVVGQGRKGGGGGGGRGGGGKGEPGRSDIGDGDEDGDEKRVLKILRKACIKIYFNVRV